MSYFSQKSLYYLVFFTENFHIFEHPFYSFPGYDKKGIGIKKLEENILKGEIGKKHTYAILYDNKTKEKIKYYKNGIEVEKFNIPKENLRIWIKYNNGNFPRTEKTTYINEEQAYWYLINTYAKSKGQRAIIDFVIIFDNKDNRIGILNKNKKGVLIGRGKYHKQVS